MKLNTASYIEVRRTAHGVIKFLHHWNPRTRHFEATEI